MNLFQENLFTIEINRDTHMVMGSRVVQTL